jgi:hypothetical protein
MEMMMQIDVTERVESAKRLTRDWADRAGYLKPAEDDEPEYSKKARDLARILGTSSFGCQQRHVHALLEVLTGEKIPAPTSPVLADYRSKEPFVVGSVLVPVSGPYGAHDLRAGMVVRRSEKGNAGLRKSNGEMHGAHYPQQNLRPATDEEIDAYFAEFFGLAVNPADEPPPPEEIPDEVTVPQPYSDPFDGRPF